MEDNTIKETSIFPGYDIFGEILLFLDDQKTFSSFYQISKYFQDYMKNVIPTCTRNIKFTPFDSPSSPKPFVYTILYNHKKCSSYIPTSKFPRMESIIVVNAEFSYMDCSIAYTIGDNEYYDDNAYNIRVDDFGFMRNLRHFSGSGNTGFFFHEYGILRIWPIILDGERQSSFDPLSTKLEMKPKSDHPFELKSFESKEGILPNLHQSDVFRNLEKLSFPGGCRMDSPIFQLKKLKCLTVGKERQIRRLGSDKLPMLKHFIEFVSKGDSPDLETFYFRTYKKCFIPVIHQRGLNKKLTKSLSFLGHFQKHRNLKKLVVIFRNKISIEGLVNLEYCVLHLPELMENCFSNVSKLRTLSIQMGKNLDELEKESSHLPRMEKLTVLGSPGMEGLFLTRMPRLRKLNVSFRGLNYQNIMNLQLSQLSVFVNENDSTSMGDFEEGLSFLNKFSSNLVDLQIGCSQNNNFDDIGSILSRMKELSSLKISNLKLSRSIYANAWSHLKELYLFRIEGNLGLITSSPLKTVEILSLDHIDTKGEIYSYFPNVSQLSLRGCKNIKNAIYFKILEKLEILEILFETDQVRILGGMKKLKKYCTLLREIRVYMSVWMREKKEVKKKMKNVIAKLSELGVKYVEHQSEHSTRIDLREIGMSNSYYRRKYYDFSLS